MHFETHACMIGTHCSALLSGANPQASCFLLFLSDAVLQPSQPATYVHSYTVQNSHA